MYRIVFRRRRVRRVRRRYVLRSIAGTQQEYALHKQRALEFVQRRLRELNVAYGFTYNRVTVRNQRTRWGSCSAKGNLSFHYKVVLLPPHLADYVLVHELCHLKEFNHSRKFWDLVRQTIPNPVEYKKELHHTQHVVKK
jgi:predicted metal-dependent hydrolase